MISALELGPDGPVGEPQVVLNPGYHLSYPFVFSWRGDSYMIPESVDEHRVELYRGIRAPYEWTLEQVLMKDIPLADCTLADVVKVNVWLDDARDFSSFNAVFQKHFIDHPPARSTVQSPLMVDAKVEMDVIAYKPLA